VDPQVRVPGGLIPSVQAIGRTVREHTGLRQEASRAFGLDYAETLRQWRDTFLTRWDDINGFGFDETFKRMWEFYPAIPRRASASATWTCGSSDT
jgi:cyclopropane-fatty-acyl-phospholipid synthase